MSVLNVISLIGIFALCAIAWLFSENRHPKYFPWRIVIMGILLQLILGALVFQFAPTRELLNTFSKLLDGVFQAADFGANFVFGKNIVPLPDKPADVNLGYIFAFRALPTVIFFSGLMALLYNIGVIQLVTNIFAKIFYSVMRLSGAEALSGAANIFVGIEAAIVVKPFLPKMTRSELCAILACCFGTAASSTLAIYVNFLRPVFPSILGHLVSASILAIPACFVLSKILVPETQMPLTAGGIPDERLMASIADESGAPMTRDAKPQKMSPLDAAITGALDGVKMSVAIAAVLILILGLVSLINQIFGGLAMLPGFLGAFFQVVNLQNILGVLFLPLTALTGISLEWNELWTASVLIGRRLFETAIPPYLGLAAAAKVGTISPRGLLIVSYALSGFAHLASVGIFVGGMTALIPSRRKDISELGWKALFVGTLATYMIACVAGVFDVGGTANLLGNPATPGNGSNNVPGLRSPSPQPAASPTASPASPAISPVATPQVSPSLPPAQTPKPTPPPPPVGSQTPPR